MGKLLEVKSNTISDAVKKFAEFFDPSVANPSPLGKAVAAGAREVYLNMQRLVPVNTDGTAQDPGLLRNSVYRYWDPKLSPNGHNIYYEIGVNLKKAPHFHLADKGHKFYKNYPPIPKGVPASRDGRKWVDSPTGYYSPKKGTRGKLGDVAGHSTPRPYLDESFSQTVISKALQTIQDVYIEQFHKITGK